MLTEFIYQWNPFNICGREVGVEDLICNPLQSSETLMLDHHGCCRRLHVPLFHASLWEKTIYWIQTHLNRTGHLEAIDKLISLFYQNLLQNPPREIETMQEFNLQINQLHSLKNDYAFTLFKDQDSSFIERRLKEIEQHVYSIFSYHYKLSIQKKEEMRKKNFDLFQEFVEQKLQKLSLECFSGLLLARFLAIAASDIVQQLFEERIQSLEERLNIIQEIHNQMIEIEKEHEGKFTIPHLNQHLNRIRKKLFHEVRNIHLEAEVLIRHVMMNDHLALSQGAKKILDSMQIHPEEFRERKLYVSLFQEALDIEIQRIQHIFKMRFL